MDVYGLGTLAMDVLIQVDTLPGEDSFCIVKSSERQPGGSGTNVIVQLARLGAKCGFIGAVGDDDIGKDVLESLAKEQVDNQSMVVKPGMTTLHTDIVIDSEGRKFIMLNMGNAFGDLKPEEVNTEVISQAKVFYTDLLPGAAAMHGLKYAKEHDVMTAFNMQVGLSTLGGLGVTAKDVLDSLAYVDVFAPCQEGLYELTGTRDLDECAKFLRKYCKGVLLFTLGKKGSVAYDPEDHKYEVPSCEIQAVDTTGAEDSYMGSFVYQFCLKHSNLEDSMKFATRCAAYTCTGIGARFTPTLQQVSEFQAE